MAFNERALERIAPGIWRYQSNDDVTVGNYFGTASDFLKQGDVVLLQATSGAPSGWYGITASAKKTPKSAGTATIVPKTPPVPTVLGIVLDGDSIFTPPDLVDKVAFDTRVPIQTFGHGGDSLNGMKDSIPAAYNALNANVLICNGGTNDLAFGRTLAQLKADAIAYVTNGKAAGYPGVYLCTIMKRTVQSAGALGSDWTSAMEADRLAYNTWLLAGNSGATGVCDNGSIAELQATTDAALFDSIGLHPTELGNYYLANNIRAFFGLAQAPVAEGSFGTVGARGTLAGANRLFNTANTAQGFVTALTAQGKTSGKWYIEIQCVTQGEQGFGFAKSGFTLDDLLGGNGTSAMVFANTNSFVSGVTLANAWSGPNIVGRSVNAIVMLAIDLDAGKAWAGIGGVWSASGNPVTGANPWVTFTPGGTWFAGASQNTNGAYSVKLPATQLLATPLGFNAWA